MSTTYVDLYSLIDDSEMQKRVKYALYFQAAYDLRLPSPDPNVLSWARAVLVDNFNPPLRQVMIRFVATPPINDKGALASDAEIQGVISTLEPDLVALASGRA